MLPPNVARALAKGTVMSCLIVVEFVLLCFALLCFALLFHVVQAHKCQTRHIEVNEDSLGGYNFLPNRGGHEKAGGSQNFFMRNRGGRKKIKRFLDGYKF